ncbi:28883_t:CDS:2, partial [Racocetra persica]
KLIQDMEDGTSFIHKHPRNVEKSLPNSLIRTQIVKLGIMYNLASKYTSFLAIDERDNELVAEAKSLPSQRIVPVSAAATYSAYQSPASATCYSRSAAYSLPPLPPALQVSSAANVSPAAMPCSVTIYNPSQANFFSALLTRKASPHSNSSESMNLPQYPVGSDSVMRAGSVSNTSNAASFSSSPIRYNISQLSYQSHSMPLNNVIQQQVIQQQAIQQQVIQQQAIQQQMIRQQVRKASAGKRARIGIEATYESFEPVLPAISVKSKPPNIETLYNFLNFQSFD